MKFGEKLEKLDGILVKLEQEKIPLEDALSLFESGVALIKDCRLVLKEVEQKISLLINDDKEE
ncbi:MAG: exodeoxyribonuclease VII small subunit [Synergistaceae bacterium]|nr:exodeoxyribonuclease VII small subunit [Synergistaceae bacterium]